MTKHETRVRTRCSSVRAMALELPEVPNHPNRVPFRGVLTRVDEASDKAPSGARGRKVVLKRQAAEEALPSLLGMAVDFTPGWDGHDARAKCGILTRAHIAGNELCVEGYLFGRDYPEIERELQARGAEAMGMSYELADAHVEDMRAEVWTLDRVTFTGAAILLRDKAAYRKTSFAIAAAKDRALPGGRSVARPKRGSPARVQTMREQMKESR